MDNKTIPKEILCTGKIERDNNEIIGVVEKAKAGHSDGYKIFIAPTGNFGELDANKKAYSSLKIETYKDLSQLFELWNWHVRGLAVEYDDSFDNGKSFNDYNLLDNKQLTDWADKGDIKSAVILADRFFFGVGGPRDFHKAFQYYSKAATNQNTTALARLGYQYFEGKGTNQDKQKGLIYYKKAADLGCIYSQYWFGYLSLFQFHKDDPINQANELEKKEAVEYLKKSADNGLTRAESQLGTWGLGFNRTGEYEALYYLEKASRKNYAGANLMLGQLYLSGSMLKTDNSKAIDHLGKAASQELSFAQAKLGIMLKEGLEIEKDDDKGTELIFKAVKQGEYDALIYAGLTFFLSDETGLDKETKERNFQFAKHYFTKAAESGVLSRGKTNTDIIKEILNEFVQKYKYFGIIPAKEIPFAKADKIYKSIRHYSSLDEPVELYLDFSIRKNGAKALLVTQNRIALVANDKIVFEKEMSYEGFDTVLAYNFGLAFYDGKIPLNLTHRKLKYKLCDLIMLLHQVSITEPAVETLKNVIENVVSHICEKGFPQKTIRIPLQDILDMCIKSSVSMHIVLDYLSMQHIEHEIRGDEIDFYTF